MTVLICSIYIFGIIIKKKEYLDALNSHTVSEGISSIKNQLNDVTNENELNENVNAFYGLFSRICDPLFKRKIIKNDIKNSEDMKHQKWFDKGCHAKRKDFYNLLNVYRNDKTDENRQNMIHVQARTEYTCKGCIKKAKYAFHKLQTNKLENARVKNAREYW